MDLNKALNRYEIIGVVSDFKINLKKELVKDLDIKNEKAFIMVGLNHTYLNKNVNDLSLSEQLKIDLATKLDKDIIILGNLSKCLIHKDVEYIKKLLLKLNNDYHKKIVIIDEDINVFMNLVKHIFVLKNKNIIYDTNNFFDDKLYDYVKMPKIIDFIKHVNKNNKKLDETLDIYELIKDIFRRCS